MLNITHMPSLIQSNNNQGFPVILADYFINAIVWISDFKPLHLEGDVDVHKYYCTWNSTTWKFCNPSYIICTLNLWQFMRNMTSHLRVTSVDSWVQHSTNCLHPQHLPRFWTMGRRRHFHTGPLVLFHRWGRGHKRAAAACWWANICLSPKSWPATSLVNPWRAAPI